MIVHKSDSESNLKPKKTSKWIENARYRKTNRKWLGYSGEIAMRILALIENDKELSQKRLAETLMVSPQYISRVIQGKENLSLETIAKLSEALQFELISFPPYKYQQQYFPVTEVATQGKVVAMTHMKYTLSDVNLIPASITESGASCVNCY